MRGFTLIEILISLLILSLVAAAFLFGLSVGSLRSGEVERGYKALVIASSQMEHILSSPFSSEYDPLSPLPAGYDVRIGVREEKSVQRIEVKVLFGGREILSMEGFKGNYELSPSGTPGNFAEVDIPPLGRREGFWYRMKGMGFVGARWIIKGIGDIGIYIYEGAGGGGGEPPPNPVAMKRERAGMIGVGMRGEGDFSIYFFNWGRKRVITEKAFIYGKI